MNRFNTSWTSISGWINRNDIIVIAMTTVVNSLYWLLRWKWSARLNYILVFAFKALKLISKIAFVIKIQSRLLFFIFLSKCRLTKIKAICGDYRCYRPVMFWPIEGRDYFTHKQPLNIYIVHSLRWDIHLTVSVIIR